MYIFDGTFADKDGTATLAQDYCPPRYFSEDLLHLVGEKRRPPYRWLVIGPPRSGSFIHVDPLATSAWNALVQGRKRWVLFPPGTPRELVAPREASLEREAVDWFVKVYPRTKLPSWTGPKPLECVQMPGETMFVPGR